VAFVTLPACYVGARVGPAFHSTQGGGRGTGVEWDATIGAEFHWGKPPVLNPLAGDTRLALSGGGWWSSADLLNAPVMPAGAPEIPAGSSLSVSGGLGVLEAGHTLWRSEGTHRGGERSSGMLMRVTGTLGMGGGTTTIDTPDGTTFSAETTLGVASAGLEWGAHTGGSKAASIGVTVGTGVRWTGYQAGPLGDGHSVAPYVSFTVEGAIVTEIIVTFLRAAGG
jgi:hypothetical protein